MAKVEVPLSHRPPGELVEVERDEIPGLIAQGLLDPEDVPPEEEEDTGGSPPTPPAVPGEAAAVTPSRAKTKPADQQGA